MKRNIFIGDIHGCYDELLLLVEKLKLTPEDTVYILGDLVNKGPKSFEVVQYIYNNRKQFKAIKGNHEVNFIKYINKTREAFSKKSQQTWDTLYKKMQSQREIFTYLKRLPYTIEKPDFICVHAGFEPNAPLEEQNKHTMTTIRYHNKKPWYEYKLPTKKTIFYGHWAVEGLNIRKQTIGLDTGCAYGGKLSAYILEEKKLIQQQSLGQYINPTHLAIHKKLKISFLTKYQCIYQKLRKLKK